MYQVEDKAGHLTAQDFAALGMNVVAYVKMITMDGAPAYAVHAADGTEMAVMANRDAAFVVIRQHDMEPLSVH